MAEIPQEWVDAFRVAAFDPGRVTSLLPATTVRKGLNAVEPLIRKQVIAEVEEALTSDEAVELAADALSPYVNEALAGIRREAPRILDLYREHARVLLPQLAALATLKGGTDV